MWLNIYFHISTLLFIVKHTLNKKMMLNSFWMFLENFREKEIAKTTTTYSHIELALFEFIARFLTFPSM